jgi:hypothetical protein
MATGEDDRVIYEIFYYYHSNFLPARIKIGGLYDNAASAISQLYELIPNFKPHVNGTVTDGTKIGWICQYKYGACNIDGGELYNLVDFEKR